jgi:hypothetical protein
MKSTSKTFHFGPDFKDVLDHLNRCPVCLSRLTAALRGIPGDDRLALLRHMARCLEATMRANA